MSRIFGKQKIRKINTNKYASCCIAIHPCILLAGDDIRPENENKDCKEYFHKVDVLMIQGEIQSYYGHIEDINSRLLIECSS